MSDNEQQQWERRHNMFGSTFIPQQASHHPPILKVYPNQKYEMFSSQQQQQQPRMDYPQHHHQQTFGVANDTSSSSSSGGGGGIAMGNNQHQQQGNFFINQLVGNWIPGTDVLISPNETRNSVQEKLPPPVLPKVVPTNIQKPRAEVKPMRMSYSDVLSKHAPVTTSSNPPTSTTPTTTTNGFQGAATNAKKESGKKATNGEKKNFNNSSDGEKFRKREKQQIPLQKDQAPGSKTESTYQGKDEKAKKKLKDAKKESKNKNKPNVTGFSKLGDEFEIEAEDEPASETYENFYNVRRTENYDKAKAPKNSKKTTTATTTTTAKLNASKQEKQSYKRQKGRKSQRMQVLEKICAIWLEYVLKFLTWLWSLVSDVIWLSYGIAYDRCYSAFAYLHQGYEYCRTEIGHNTNRPSVWLKNLWRRFDGNFEKNSRWAFWRWSLWKRQASTEATDAKDGVKTGRLPSTADEAMSNLLNCKGKDAYSILGVTPDCSQEQIRKHYKKIAVLVHPDKNKQPGAEEAFKVLQRSFELIGEPENRMLYDQGMAEALHAEKEWSELNDLLKQLHTKIAEAANTIRCSSCSSRHPRKPTGRPPYAARNCNSCRIRHSAREGDIWAETTFFGLKWKYMALIEGTVYEITEWAKCQEGSLSHLQPNSHVVSYRIVLGQNNQQSTDKEKRKEPSSSSEPTMDDILSNIYSGQNQQQSSNSRRRKNK